MLIPQTNAADYGGYAALDWVPDSSGSNSITLPVRFFAPPVTTGSRRPLILFLHGAGERGNDNLKHIEPGQWGTGIVPEMLAAGPVKAGEPCFVLAPQCPDNSRWVEWDWERGSYDSSKVHVSACINSVLGMLDWTVANYPIVQSRLYVCGLSMGGYGCWDTLARRPDTFAAALAICGGGDPRAAARFAATPVWAFHGAKDSSVPVQASRDMVDALRAAGVDPRYTEIAGGDHGAWVPFCAEPDVIPWMLSKRR